MPAPFIVSFARFEDLAAARERLLAAGLAPGAVQAHVADDDGGPVEGNFVSGNGRPAPGGRATADVRTGAAVDYDRDFATTAARGAHVLVVEPADDAQRAQVAEILGGFDAVDVGAASARGRRS
ncbi:MAG TPA: hypothetical protein VFZ93_08630 [Albitalea sp.]